MVAEPRKNPSPVWGQHDHTLDDKGRVALPAEFRAEWSLGEGSELVLSRHIKLQCVVIYQRTHFDRMLSEAQSSGSNAGRELARVVGGASRRITLDRIGRIGVPAPLRQFASLAIGCCFIIGQNDHIEIWNEQTWNKAHDTSKYENDDFSAWM